MSTDRDLKQTEKESFKLAAYADGTSDISLGVIFTLLGIYPFTREVLGVGWNTVVFLIALALISLLQMRIRARLIPERIGVVKFGPHVRQRKIAFLLITILLAAGMIGTWVLSARGWSPSFPDWLRGYGFEILVSVIVLGIFWAIAYSMGLRRFYFYGVLLAACFPIQASLTNLYEGTPFIIVGSVIILVGAILLNRFLKEYPAGSGIGEAGNE